MEEQKSGETNNNNWLEQEAEETKSTSFDGDKLPALELKENIIVEMTIDFSNPFQKWDDTENKTVKKIIPVTVKGEKLVWWLNVKNPIYGQIIRRGLRGQTVFKILQTGKQNSTRYTLIEDENETLDKIE